MRPFEVRAAAFQCKHVCADCGVRTWCMHLVLAVTSHSHKEDIKNLVVTREAACFGCGAVAFASPRPVTEPGCVSVRMTDR